MMIFCFLVMLFVDFCLNRDYVCDIIRCTDVLRASLASVELSVGATNDVDSLANIDNMLKSRAINLTFIVRQRVAKQLHRYVRFRHEQRLQQSSTLPLPSSKAKAKDCKHCVHGNCDKSGECVCSPDQWRPGHKTRYWENFSYVGEQCDQKLQCPQDCRGKCVQHNCICNYGFVGKDCSTECLSISIPDCSSALSSVRVTPVDYAKATTIITAVAKSAARCALLSTMLNSLDGVRECSPYTRKLRIAYLLTIHDTRTKQTSSAALKEQSSGLAQFQMLLTAIWDEQHYYAIHVPPASSAHWRRLLQRIVARFGAKNIVVMSESVSVVWSGYRWILLRLSHQNRILLFVVAAMLVGIERLLRMSNDWDLFINLSGTDFPLVSNEQLAKVLVKRKTDKQ